MSYRGRVGLGLTTFQRPELYRRCIGSVVTHLAGLLDVTVVLQDGGDYYLDPVPAGWHVIDQVHNQGWSVAKNTCLQYLLNAGCDHLFMIEDDTTVTSWYAVAGYVDAAMGADLHYLTAHPWGQTTTALVATEGPVSFWAYCGSWWTYMTAEGLRTGGGYDNVLGDTMGDIELPQRWKRLGLTGGWGRLPDATGSEAWVKPSCLTIPESTIANRPGWVEKQQRLLAWWAETMPETLPIELRPAHGAHENRRCLPA